MTTGVFRAIVARMPHVIVKLWPGKSEQQKKDLAEALSHELMRVIGASAQSVSVGIEEVTPEEWTEQVYEQDIEARPATIYKHPGYRPPR